MHRSPGTHTPVPADSGPRCGAGSIAHPRIENPLLTVAPSVGVSTAIVAPVTLSVTVIGIVIVRSGLVEVTSSVAVWTPGASPALDAMTRNVFAWVRSAVPAGGCGGNPTLIRRGVPGKAAVHPVATTLGLVTFMIVVDVVDISLIAVMRHRRRRHSQLRGNREKEFAGAGLSTRERRR